MTSRSGKEINQWFSTWFDSPYYHLLYRNRDKKEAAFFIDKIIAHFELNKGQRVLDLACGRGRHSIHLSKENIDVVGVDLSPMNIEYAKDFETDNLEFHTHDMRQPLGKGQFDTILNLFTSFAYFGSREEDLKVLRAIQSDLKPGGRFLIDFLNVEKLFLDEVQMERKVIEGIEFNISKRLEGKQIVKQIDFHDEGQRFHFEERVDALNRADFTELFEHTDLRVSSLFGDYHLNDFDARQSERLIISGYLRPS